MQFIIFDLEATCWSGNRMGRTQEIIEIGAFSVTSFGEAVDKFHSFVHPVVNPSLSVYCQKLTGIRQKDVDPAPAFGEVASDFIHWLNQENESYTLCSWGSTDLELLENDCALHHIDLDWIRPYLDLKAQYHQLKNLDTKKGLVRTLAAEGLDFEGQHHRALDDAANLVRLFTRYLDMWMY